MSKIFYTNVFYTNSNAILVLVMIFCGLVQRSSKEHAKIDEKVLNMFCFKKGTSAYLSFFQNGR